MSTTLLKLHTPPQVPLETEVISPTSLSGLSESGIEHLQVMHGNVKAKLGDFFKVTGKGGSDIHLEGDLSNVKMIGTGMSTGKITIDGDVGMHVGMGMSGGEILVHGDAGDWVGPEMSGGRIVVKGNAGHMVGSAYRGQPAGISGGEIFIHGNAKNEIGNSMRRGFIAIGGNAGDFTGVNMLAGTIIVAGEMGIRTQSHHFKVPPCCRLSNIRVHITLYFCVFISFDCKKMDLEEKFKICTLMESISAIAETGSSSIVVKCCCLQGNTITS